MDDELKEELELIHDELKAIAKALCIHFNIDYHDL